MLKPEGERLSDVDVAIELTRKEADFDVATAQNRQRVEELAFLGRRFRNFLEAEFCWYLETFKFLKGGSRVIALADLQVEKALVLAVPHRWLLGEPEQVVEPSPVAPPKPVRKRRPRDCPF